MLLQSLIKKSQQLFFITISMFSINLSENIIIKLMHAIDFSYMIIIYPANKFFEFSLNAHSENSIFNGKEEWMKTHFDETTKFFILF